MVDDVVKVINDAGVTTAVQFQDFEPERDGLEWPQGTTKLPGKKALVRAAVRAARLEREAKEKNDAALRGVHKWRAY